MCQICRVAMKLQKNNLQKNSSQKNKLQKNHQGNSPLSDTRKFSLLMEKPTLIQTLNFKKLR